MLVNSRRFRGFAGIDAGGLHWSNEDAYHDFRNGVRGMRDGKGDWVGADAIYSKVEEVDAVANNDSRLLELKAQFIAESTIPLEAAQHFQPFGMFGRDAAMDAMYRDAMGKLQNAMSTYVSRATQLAEEIQRERQAAADAAAAQAKIDAKIAADKRKAEELAAAQQQAEVAQAHAATAAAQRSETWGKVKPIVFIGGAAVVLGGAAYFLTRRRRPAAQ